MDRRRVKQEISPETNSLRELLEGRQTELNDLLEELGPELAAINGHIDEVARSMDQNRDDVVRQLARDAVNHLDKKWPFYGDVMHVTGTWYVTNFELDRESMHFPMVRQDAFNSVQSNGFAVFSPEDGPPRVGLSFAYDSIPLMLGAVQGNVTLLTYADPSDVSIYYVRPQKKEELKSDTSTLANELTLHDRLLMLHYHDANSEFYRRPARKQLEFLTRMTDTVNSSLPSPYNGYKAKCEQAEVPYVYRRITDGLGDKWQKVAASGDDPLLVAGYVEGVGVLEVANLVKNVPIRNKDELVDADAGLCLIMQIDECSIPDIFNNQPVYLPVRLASQLELAAP
ncbi:TPA: hypothetical protein DCF80_00565 [Candidatus Saccharibacteria bacterium]|nr:hypothetical protein [Candidatus Saccharibacteria bacterium]HRK40903.1 hypothetical protein [Candidatus Saccharibacteria bacterium]